MGVRLNSAEWTLLSRLQHFAERLRDTSHQLIIKPSQWHSQQAAVIDRANLIDQQVGLISERLCR